MNKIIFIVGLLAAFALFGSGAHAMGQNGGGQINKGIHEPTTGIENPELKEQNQGTGQGLQVENTSSGQVADVDVTVQQKLPERLHNGSELGNAIQNREQKEITVQVGDEASVGEQRRSQVANAVQEILQIADKNSGIGEQVRVIAQAQNQIQEKLDASLQKIQNRSKLIKFFIGLNYNEIKNTKKVLEQNREQIEQLNELRTQLVNQVDLQNLTSQIQTLEQANTMVENSLNNIQSGFSLFGWLVKLF
ncbi:MAG: hypothetical protein WCX97_05035 [Candidatus Magasanikbacteria bacterium]